MATRWSAMRNAKPADGAGNPVQSDRGRHGRKFGQRTRHVVQSDGEHCRRHEQFCEWNGKSVGGDSNDRGSVEVVCHRQRKTYLHQRRKTKKLVVRQRGACSYVQHYAWDSCAQKVSEATGDKA
jgi:hypothetical protein